MADVCRLGGIDNPYASLLDGEGEKGAEGGGMTVGVVPPRRLGRKIVRSSSSMGSNRVEMLSTTR